MIRILLDTAIIVALITLLGVLVTSVVGPWVMHCVTHKDKEQE